MKRLAVAVFSLLLSSVAVGADWEYLVSSKDGLTLYYIDLDSITKTNRHVAGMYNEPLYSIYIQETYKKGTNQRKKGYYYTKINYLIACNRKEYFNNAIAIYNTKGDVINSWKANTTLLSESDFNAAFPETIASAIIERTCEM